ncbi:MAG: glycosyltransferase [Patescibacteria group bacterium]
MKILFVTNLYSPILRGGAERLAQKIAEGYVVRGHEVSVLTTRNEKLDDIVSELQNGARVYRFSPKLPYHILEDATQPFWKRLLWHAKDLCPKTSFDVAKKIIGDIAPDIIFSHNLRGMGMGVARAIRRSNVKWIHTLHDVQLIVPSGQWWTDRWSLWQSCLIRFPYSMYMKRLMGSPNIVVSPSRFLLDLHNRAGLFSRSKKTRIVNPAPAHLSYLSDRPHGSALFVGQLTDGKGLKTLFSALNNVSRPLRLRVIGDGPMRSKLSEEAQKLPPSIKVEFLGNASQKDTVAEMEKASVLVVPSVITENCPGVILEAASVGLPVIATKQGGIPELVSDENLFAPNDADALAKLLSAESWPNVKALSSTIDDYLDNLLAL